mmetsp:Transcript_16779/g.27567  ORF Transcript_16779/g.27567 Transcript_16779/m.27567 type:complete len:696 (+) Transcript_16779:177-2264(+)
MEYATVVLPVAVTTTEPVADDVRAETALAVVLPVAAANLAAALVSAAATVNEATNNTLHVQKDDVGCEDAVGAQHFEKEYHQQHSTASQGALESVMANTTISLERATCIESLEQLITRLSTLSDRSSGISPGFDCIDNALPWKQTIVFPQYETLSSVNATKGIIPLASPESSIELFELIKLAWQKRLDYEKCDTEEERESYCSCIGHWRSNQNVMKQICNQVLEQVMTREASACLRSQPAITRIWNEAYSHEACPYPDTMDCLYIDSSIRLLTNDTYLHAYIEAALAATSTIDVSICYLFYSDPQSKYILLDLLPYVAERGVKVRVLFELAILESQCLQMPLDGTSIDREAPLHLPKGSPSYARGAKKFRSATELVREFFNLTSATNIEARYWFARDKTFGYRVKNHGKCHIFDGNSKNGKVIAGGSNVAPRPGSLDTDFVIQGQVAGMYSAYFDSMWTAMAPDAGDLARTISEAEEKKECEDEQIAVWEAAIDPDIITGHKAKILFLPSTPSSSGEDVILRCVLGAIYSASQSIYLCMGHFNVPEVVAQAFKQATDRGVKVYVISNSFHSCDLRTGQLDLMRSLKRMLTVAPDVKLFVAAVKDGKVPPFLHSKYLVVDSRWACSGSWNMWMRSAFYEMEAEIFVQSESFASDLEEKFTRESERFCIPVKTVDECNQFLPKGCSICEGFGPFFDV